MAEYQKIEAEGKKKGRRVSIAFHTVILLLAFLWGCPYEPEKAQARQYAVAVTFEKPIEFKPAPSSNSNKAKEKEGAMKKKADPVAKIEKKTEVVEIKTPKPEVKLPTPKPPTPRPPVPAPPIQSESTSIEETDVVVADVEVEVEEVEDVDTPEPEVIDVPKPSKVKITPRVNKGSGKTNTSKSDNQSDSPNSAGDGSGSGKGSQGSGKGADASGNDGDSGRGTGGTGLGEYDDSGNGIFGRRVIYRNIQPILKEAASKSGKIHFKVCINPRGMVNYAELNELETTITDRSILKSAIDAIYGYKFEPNPGAPDEECGKIVINVENFNGLRGGGF